MSVWRLVAGGVLLAAAAVGFVPITGWIGHDGWLAVPAVVLAVVLAASALLLLPLPVHRRDGFWMAGAVVALGTAALDLPELGGDWLQLAYVSKYAAAACLVPPFLRYPAQPAPARTVARLTVAAWAVLVGLPLLSSLFWQPWMGGYTEPNRWFAVYRWEDAARFLPRLVPWLFVGVAGWFTAVQWRRQRTAGGPARTVVRLLAALTTAMAWGLLARTAVDLTEAWELVRVVNVVHVSFTAAAVLVILAVAMGLTLRRAAYVEDLVAAAGRPDALERVLQRHTGDASLCLLFLTDEGWTDTAGRTVSAGADAGRATFPVVEEEGTTVVAVEVDAHVDLGDRATRAILGGAGYVLRSARLAVQQAAQARELEESRRRIVEASVTQRRQLERDLHDGAQQHLLAAQAALSRAELVQDPGAVTRAVRDARTRLETTMEELRRLARGVHPALLSQAGLGAALESLTASSDRVRVRVSPALEGRRFPPVIEATAWFVASEAVVNALRHHDGPVAVEATLDGDSGLVCTVRDEGPGGAVLSPGGGLAGLRDRVRATGGSLDVSSSPGAGTTVRAWLPLGPPGPGRGSS